MIRLQHELHKGDFRLNVDVEIPDTGVTGIFGESGSGKTTLLRCIAGLERDSGVEGGAPHARNIGYVFQDANLFPHLSVRGNIDYGARRATVARVDRQQVIDMLELHALLDRRPDDLSGGEAQRVAIATALLCSPDLVLLDEPLAALDRRRRDALLPYFDRLRDELSIPMIYVSHDIEEVSRLCDHLVLIDQGQVVASGALQQVLSRLDLPMLHGSNAGVVIYARPDDVEDGLTRFRFADEALWVPGEFDTARNSVRLRIAANDVSLCRERPSQTTILNVIPATIDQVHPVDDTRSMVRLDVGNQKLLAQVTNRSVARLDLKAADRVFAQVKSVTVKR